jgi:hypothetical protein
MSFNLIKSEIMKHFSDGLVASQLKVFIILGLRVGGKYALSSIWTLITLFKSMLFPQLQYLKRYGLTVLLETITKIIKSNFK